ncbi:hypothetical protein ACS5PN_16465 [Roseateles sp. NT4]|uniref:hypothetical protein n=1 Tax=Roseateles sp. NT4 TaxID=3453715 RepID=UPI003EE851AE
MAITTYNVDRKLDQTLEDLRRHYGAASKAEVLRKAVAILKLAQEHERADGSLWIRGVGVRTVRVIMR